MSRPPSSPIQVEDTNPDGVMIHSSSSLSSGSDSDIIVSTGSSPSVSMVKEESVPVSPQEFKELLLSQEKQTAMAFFLLLITGLPQCGKSGAIQKFLKFFQKTPNRSPPQHGLSFYQLAAVEDAVPGRLHIKALGYSEMTSEDCYVYAMKLAMKQIVAGKPIRYKESGSIPADQFRNHDLNVHFREMFLQLKKAEANKWVSQNMALFNVWDIGHSRTVYHFLPALHGLLSHSYSWLFFDLQRDSQNLYKPPAVPADENFMKWRPRLHYLIRAAKLNLPTQKKVCTMFAMNNEKLQETECKRIIRSVTPNFKNTAKQIGVKEIIDFNNIVTTIDRSNDRTCVQEITKHMDSMVFEAFEDKISMPFSFLFLRSFYHKKNDLVYVKKQEIIELAEELGISAEQFCKLFTSYGSIIDVSLVDLNSKYVILKPNVFIEELNKVFYTDDPVLANIGILRMSFAQETFESHAQAYMDIFVSFGLAVKLARERIELPPTLNVEDDSTVLYLPDIRRTPPLKDDTELRPNVLRMLRSWNAPLGHLQVSFVAKFLESHKEAKLCILEDSPTNLTKIKALDTKNEIEVIFDVVCLGYTLEFRIEKENEEIFTQIVDTCHTLMEHHVTTRYSFAIMCSKDPIIKAKYELTRERHLLPYETLCDECMKGNRVQDPILAMWNKVVKSKQVPEDQKLNGDPIQFDDVHNIVEKMKTLNSGTMKHLAEKLGFTQVDYDTKFSIFTGWKLPMAILMECEKLNAVAKSRGSDSFSKGFFARKLAETANEIQLDSDREILHDVVRLLHDEVLINPTLDDDELTSDETQFEMESIDETAGWSEK